MITWREGTVTSTGRSWAGAVELEVDLDDGRRVRALAYPSLVGDPAPGRRVLLNVTALDRGLGTGGYGLVVAVPEALPTDRGGAPGHLVKARYSPLPPMVLGVDEQESVHHQTLRDADDLAGLPVVVADLHSSLPAIVAGLRHGAQRDGRPQPRVAYLMTDGGALPAWFSRTVGTLREADWITTCITVGQAFGGDLEAVTVHTGLLAARLVADADAVVVTQGPGNLGTGTRWGFSGVAAGEVINATGTLGGAPVAALRVSGADPRPRHRGVSHHSLTAYGRVALVPADVVVPVADPRDPPVTPERAAFRQQVADQAAALCAPHGRHRLVRVPAGAALREVLTRTPVRLSSMGRGLDEDPEAFLTAAAAGLHAATLVR